MKKEIYIFGKNIEQEALDQFNSAMQQPFAVQGALMADAHAGYSLPIGAVVATKGVILPSWVGFDIGCGICGIKTDIDAKEIKRHSKEIFSKIYLNIPTGFDHHKKDQPWDNHKTINRSDFLSQLFNQGGLKQLGTLGSGNHFIELGSDENGELWVLVHSGSRGLGHDVAEFYMKAACGGKKARDGHFTLSASAKDGKDYIMDLNFCLEFALENRKQIILRVLKILGEKLGNPLKNSMDLKGLINQPHNHAELKKDLWIHRKGATQAEKGMLTITGGNMRDGCFVVQGLGNPKSLCSSSHGAGRILGRRKAKKLLSLQDFKTSMKGITAKVSNSTLDESPAAYKDIFHVLNTQKTLVKQLHHIKPMINIKS